MKIDIVKYFFLLLFSLQLSAGSIKFTSNCEILTSGSSSSIKNSAKELQKYLNIIFDASIKIVDKDNPSKVTIILTKKDGKPSQNEAFFIKIQNENIIITGSNDRAVFYGVYHFLEYYLGCKFLTKDFEYIPKFNQIVLKNIYDKQMPYFIYREIFSDESDGLEFATKCRLNGRLGHRGSDEYKDDLFPKGKVIYNQFVSSSLINDDSYECNGQYDFSSPEVSRIAAKSVNKKLLSMDITADDYILIEHEDRDSYCTTGLSSDQAAGEPFLKYSTYIANHFKDTNILYQAYQWSRTPPKKVKKLPQNMSIFFSPIEADFAKSLDSLNNQEIFDDLKKWDEFGNDIFIWHYTTNFGGYFQPYSNIYALDKDIKLFASLEHVKGIFLQSSYGTFGGELADLRTWVFSKLLWKPDSDINELIKEFCDYYYGKASRSVQKYIRVLHKIHQKMGERLLVKSSVNEKYLHPKFLLYLEKILEDGLEKVKDEPLYKEHVLKLFSGIDYVRVIRGDNDKNLKKSRERFKHFLEDENIDYFSEGGKTETIKKIIDIDRKTPFIPKEAKGLKEGIDWFDFQEYTFKLCCADIVADVKSSDGVSAVMKGDLDEWGFQLEILNFPKGKWDIYASVKIEYAKETSVMDSANVAYRYGIHPTFIKGVKLFGQCKDGVYQSVKIGSIDTSATNAKTIWLSPAENDKVKAIYVDRIYIVRKKENMIIKEQ